MFHTEEFKTTVKGGMPVEIRYDHMDGEIYGWSLHSPKTGKLWEWLRLALTPKQRAEVDEACWQHYQNER